MKLLPTLLGLCLFFFTTHLLSARDVDQVPLFVQDARTGEPLEGVSLRIGEENKLLFTDELGKVYLPKGTEQLQIQVFYLGYEDKKVMLQLYQDQRLSLKLTPKSIELAEVTILADARQNLQKINTLDQQIRPIRSSQDILRQVPGLFIAQHAGGGKAEQIFLRGFDIDHGTDIQISVDGMPVNMVSHAHGQGYADLHFLIPETVQSVEFDKGSYEGDKGNFATAGHVNFRTKNSLAQNELKVELGQYNTFRGLAMLDLIPENEKHQAYVATEYLRSKGYFEASQNFIRTNIFAKYTGSISPSTLLKFSASTFESSWDASGQIPERAVRQGIISRFGAIDSTEGGNTGRSNLNLEIFQGLGSNSMLQSQFYVNQYDFKLFSNFTFFLEDSVNGDQIMQEEDRLIYGNNTSLKRQFSRGKITGESVAGFSMRVDKIRDIGLFRTKNRTEILESLADGEIDETNAAFFLKQSINLDQKLFLEASLRYDWFSFSYLNQKEANTSAQSTTKGIFSPKLKISYEWKPEASFYLHMGKGFHSNDSRVVIANQTDAILPASYGADLGAFIKPMDKLLLQMAAWWLDLEQEFVYVGDGGFVEPSGRSRRMGVDMSLRYQLLSWLFLDVDANYTHARARDEAEGENFIPLAPIFSSTGGLRMDLKNGFSASLRYRHLGDRAANEDYSILAEGYHIWDGGVQYESTHFRIGLTAENLFNVAWKEAQFETTSRLMGEANPVTEIHYTPGTPFFARLSLSYLW